ncbi:MAG: nucleoside hydrolase [Planctomycetes bacterium]|nr:nucleoside hydrolase [Planctomycetota bacterium]
MKTIAMACLVAWMAVNALAAVPEPSSVRLIFDTDIQGDADDVGTVAVLHALADSGEVEILAMGVSSKNPSSPLCLSALNTYFGRGDIPLGVLKGPGSSKRSRYARKIAEEFPRKLNSIDEAPDAAMLYRRVLTAADENSVVIVSVGFLSNLRNLLITKPDKLSPLDGRELVAKKVKTWVCMGGQFPKGPEACNLRRDAPAAAYAIEHWPTPIIFSGGELGVRIQTGAGLTKLPADSPVRRAYELYNGLTNRASWDQTAVLYAVRGLEGGLKDVWDLRTKGSMHFDASTAYVEWRDQPQRDHAYLVEKMPPDQVARMIETLMLHLPTDSEKR